MLVKVESATIEISVVTVHCTIYTSEIKNCTVCPMNTMTHGKNKGQPLNDVQPQVGEGSLTFCGVTWPGKICLDVEALVGFVQARYRGEQDGLPSKA